MPTPNRSRDKKLRTVTQSIRIPGRSLGTGVSACQLQEPCVAQGVPRKAAKSDTALVVRLYSGAGHKGLSAGTREGHELRVILAAPVPVSRVGIGALAEVTGIPGHRVDAYLASLEHAGLVELDPDPLASGRRLAANVTSAGRAFFDPKDPERDHQHPGPSRLPIRTEALDSQSNIGPRDSAAAGPDRHER